MKMHPSVVYFIAGVSLISPAGIELCSFEQAMPHTHAEVYWVASASALTYTVSASTTGTGAIVVI